ncbi:hypothetical protein FIBSPDRAFT_765788 [Athelia psychrophila]|uniref:Uncharacterized protein n=1 Tax=Athelia psychrophila TaxID=1759441 RepID=A0A167VX67_9AGAM|nr:hypothetical protein FIBSPDRAFT_765788 [Fibularhizoctonia sp. CBS 109695]
MQVGQYYSHLYYKDKSKGIQDYVDKHWPAEAKKPVLPGQKKPRRLDYGNKVTSMFLKRETKEFQAQLEKDRDEKFSQDMKEYNEKLEGMDKSPQTAEDYHMSLANSAAFLQPLADLAAKRFGAAVSILMVLPIGTNDGKVEMRR